MNKELAAKKYDLWQGEERIRQLKIKIRIIQSRGNLISKFENCIQFENRIDIELWGNQKKPWIRKKNIKTLSHLETINK